MLKTYIFFKRPIEDIVINKCYFYFAIVLSNELLHIYIWKCSKDITANMWLDITTTTFKLKIAFSSCVIVYFTLKEMQSNGAVMCSQNCKTAKGKTTIEFNQKVKTHV